MNGFFEWIIRRRWPVLFCTALALVLGVLAWIRLPIDAFPDVTNIQVMILTKAPGLSARDMEQRITYPIELVMGGLPKATQVRSMSRAGLSQVIIVFQDGTDPYFTRQVVFERLQNAKEDLPPGVEPELGPLSTGLGEIFQYTLEGENFTPMEKRTIQNWLVTPMLRNVHGVTEVNSFGGEVKQYQVIVLPERLVKYGLTLRDVMDALEQSNSNAGAGYILKGWEQMYIRGVGLFQSIGDIEAVSLKAKDGTPVYLKDLAEVRLGPQVRQGAATRDGKGETVCGMAIMLRGENSKTVVSAVKEAAEKLQESLPKGLKLDVFYDRTELIEACIKTVMDALMEGGILVILVLFLFLAEFRTALIVVVSLPITFLLTFIVMSAMGLSSNLMTLGGMAFSVGMVVDASIVVAENVRRHLAENRDPSQRGFILVEAMLEVARPVSFSVLIIALVLVPLFTLQGLEGKMFGPLALTLLVCLLISIGVAMIVVPALSALLLRQTEEREFKIVRRFREGYFNLLQKAMRHPRVTFGLALAVLVLSLFLIPFMGTEFMPPLDEGSIAINVVRLPNASLDGSVAVGTMMEKRILNFPEVATVVSKTGRAEISEDPMGPEQTDVFIMLKPRRQWKTGRNKAELVEALNKDLSQVPGIRMSFSQPIALRVNELISGVKSDLAIKVFGSDLAILKEFSDKAAGELATVEGARDVRVEQVSGMVEVSVTLKAEALARYGIRVGSVNDLLEAAYAGKTVSRFVEGDRRFDIVVRFPDEARRDLASLSGLLIPAPNGERVPLGQVASIRVEEGPMQISRERGMRRVVVESNIRGRDLGGFVKEVQRKLGPAVRSLPTGYFVEYGGQFENQQRAMRQLGVVVPIVLLLILFLLYSALGTARNALLVILNLPFALVGGVVAATLFRMTLSVSAAVAFIVLLGIAVQNGVVLVAFFKQLREQGQTINFAVTEGCRLRFKPLFMTALVSFIGHLPMVYAMGSGSDIQKPLAVIVMGGIVTSTLLTLFVVPVLYYAIESRAEKAAQLSGSNTLGEKE